MDCCNYGEYRGAAYGAGAAYDGYGYAPPAYSHYAHGYYAPHAHDPYARYYRYEYPGHQMHHADHGMPMDYGMYATKEARARRAVARRERALTPAQHLPLPPTPPLECAMTARAPAYCEQPMWPHYQQMGVVGGGWGGAVGGVWSARACAREHARYALDCTPMKGPYPHSQNQVNQQDGRTIPYPVYEDFPFNGEGNPRHRNTPEFTPGAPQVDAARSARARYFAEQRRSPPEEKRPPPVAPLPAFQQAFGSTEIGKFAEAFSRTEVAADESSTDNFLYESFSDWDGPIESQWCAQPASREIKCEENY